MNLLIKTSLFLSLLSPMMSYSQIVCDVPVCQIEDEVQVLRSKNGDQRGMYAIELKNKYKDSKNAKELENIYELGLKLKTLFAELKDEDWVQRAAADLVNTVVFNLAKYSEVDSARLAKFYSELSTQTFRYNLISYWHNNLVNIENIHDLEELVTFADAARSKSIEIQDEDWVPNAASALISDITIKLTNLDPAHEGLYDVRLSEQSVALGTLPFDKIAVLDSSSSRNLVVVFINSKLRTVVYSYSHAEIKGNKLTGLFLSTGDMANRFAFELNRRSGEVVGYIERTDGDKLDFNGQQTFSTRSVFEGKAPVEVTAKDIIGTLKGELAGVKGSLSIRSFKDNVYSATFRADTGSVIISFQGKFFPKNAILSLTSNDKIKLTLGLRETDKGVLWRGASFSTTTGIATQAEFSPLK